MARTILEERVMKCIEEIASAGRLIIRIDEVAALVGEPKSPVYQALKKLEDRKLLKSYSRGRMGIEIVLPSYNAESKETEKINEQNTAINYQAISGPEKYDPIEKITSELQNLSLEQLNIIEKYVLPIIMKNKR